MALKQNPTFNPNLPESATNQRMIFETPQVINPQTGQLSTGGYTTPTITPGDLEPVSGLPYVNPNQPPIPPPPEIPPTTPVLGPKEQSISDLIAELTTGPSIAGEKAGYQVEQEKAAGLEAMKASEADYTARLGLLKAEYANVPLQVEKEFLGRAGVGQQERISGARLREISIEANTVGALLAATQGKITFAQSQVDRAVNAKYAQAEADRKAKLENLQLLSQDPALTAEQKARADAQTAKLKKEAETEAKKKEDTSQIMKWAVELATNPVIAQQLMKMAQEDDPNLETAFALYTQNKPAEVSYAPGAIGEFERLYGRTPTAEELLEYRRRSAEAGRAPVKLGIPVILSEADTELRQKIGEGGFVDINVYRDIRAKYGGKGVPIATFDSAYSDYLSPSDRARFGIGKAVGFQATGELKDSELDAFEQIMNKALQGQ